MGRDEGSKIDPQSERQMILRSRAVRIAFVEGRYKDGVHSQNCEYDENKPAIVKHNHGPLVRLFDPAPDTAHGVDNGRLIFTFCVVGNV